MIYCLDTYYFEDKANTACVGIEEWTSETIAFETNQVITGIAEYESGSFYKRELPCLTSILETINLDVENDIIVIDGYVVLDDNGKLSLGGYLFEALNGKIPVVGVAKNNFIDLVKLKRPVYRGESKKPLFVTAKGMDVSETAACIKSMHGDFRFPTILKKADQRSRELGA